MRREAPWAIIHGAGDDRGLSRAGDEPADGVLHPPGAPGGLLSAGQRCGGPPADPRGDQQPGHLWPPPGLGHGESDLAQDLPKMLQRSVLARVGHRRPTGRRCPRLRSGAVASNLETVNAVEDRHDRARCAAECRFHVGGLPPHGAPFQQRVGECARALAFGRIGKLLVAAEHDDTQPPRSEAPFPSPPPHVVGETTTFDRNDPLGPLADRWYRCCYQLSAR